MKKVLVTGATGFIGNYVIEELLQQHCQVIASATNTEKEASYPWFKEVQFIPFDLTTLDEKQNYYQYFDQPDTVIHLAWQGLPDYKAPFHLEKNLPIHSAFIKNLIVNGLKDLTITGTCLEYGMQDGCLSEDA